MCKILKHTRHALRRKLCQFIREVHAEDLQKLGVFWSVAESRKHVLVQFM